MRLKVIDRGQWTLLAVCSDRGECLLQEFLEGLAPNLRGDGARLSRLLERAAENGPQKNTDINHKIHDDIWEFIQGRLRVLYFCDQGRLIVCSHGLVKRWQNTLPREVRRAEEARKRYMADKGRNAVTIEEE
jgi:hypothetical protein